MHAPLGSIDVFAAKLPALKFVPQLHGSMARQFPRCARPAES